MCLSVCVCVSDTLSAQPGSEIAYNHLQDQVLPFGSLYHDASSAFFFTHHNVVDGGPMWLYLQHPPIGAVHDLTVSDNWYSSGPDATPGGCARPASAQGFRVQGRDFVAVQNPTRLGAPRERRMERSFWAATVVSWKKTILRQKPKTSAALKLKTPELKAQTSAELKTKTSAEPKPNSIRGRTKAKYFRRAQAADH